MAIICRECGEELSAPGIDICGDCTKTEIDRLERLKLETVAYYLNDNRDGKNVQLDFEVDMIAIEHDLWLAQGGSENREVFTFDDDDIPFNA